MTEGVSVCFSLRFMLACQPKQPHTTTARGEFDPESDVIRAYCQEILSVVQEVVVLNPLLRDRLAFFSERSIDVHNPFKLADLAATISAGSPEKLQAVLAEKSAEGRLRLALGIISEVRENWGLVGLRGWEGRRAALLQ